MMRRKATRDDLALSIDNIVALGATEIASLFEADVNSDRRAVATDRVALSTIEQIGFVRDGAS